MNGGANKFDALPRNTTEKPDPDVLFFTRASLISV